MSYSLASLLKEYSENKEQIDSYLQNKTVEGYDTCGNTNPGVLVALLVVSMIIWVLSMVVTIIFWEHLPDWARVIAVLGLIPIIPGGPIVTLVVVYITKGSRRSGHRGKKKSRSKKKHP